MRVSSPLFILLVFSTLGLIGILNHEMWRDEMNTWLIVRDSSSLGEMLGYVNYQGHPALWALLVSFVSNISSSPQIMQLLHWSLGTTAIAIFLYQSKFPRWQKILFTFGYLPFYEYFLISRPYVLGMLWLFLFCALYPSRKKTYLKLSITLGLMANSHAFAAIISFAAFLALSLEFFLDKEQRATYQARAIEYDLLLSLVILIGFYCFAFAILNPPIDSVNVGGREGWNLAFDLRHGLRVLGRLLGGYILIIPNSRQWLDLVICDIIGISIFLLTAAKLIRNRTPFFFYAIATSGMLGFFYFRYMGHGARHYGYLYLVFIAALWLAQHHQSADWIEIKVLKIGSRSLSINKVHQVIFTITLLAHFFVGLYRFPGDLSVPFSAGHETAEYIKSSQLEEEFIMASPDVNMAALSGYLDRKLYYPELQGMGSFTIFQQGRRTLVEPEDILAQSKVLLPSISNGRILLVVNTPLSATDPGLNIAAIAQFEKSWHRSERMYLYWISLK
ncbi:hypothetical protein [Roseofilum casamattae]|uniref:Glycosyltransferase RgtA/B/C/D-like domain-containing protein n=1 Tax=Roseofilum casamattae BLCC-M143 TaxID=3022442 RepID=A0ABT7BWM7_9CYAN|nr:hypothetical protein [Roseofilum casamattae]MDJ1183571.1 hypothetical protein [Roseofilum casamattae BLCC-M143]